MDEPQPPCRRRHCARRPYHRRGLAPPFRRSPCRAGGACGLQRVGRPVPRPMSPWSPAAIRARRRRAPRRLSRPALRAWSWACSIPTLLVAGRGNEALRRAGIEVAVGVLEPSCRAVNEPFLHAMEQRRPLVIAKYAMTLDGKVATREGLSRWVTGEAARRRVHEDRHRHAGVMVGIGHGARRRSSADVPPRWTRGLPAGARRGRCRRAPSPGIPTGSHGKRGARDSGRGRGRAAGSPQRPGRARMRGGCGACERRSR